MQAMGIVLTMRGIPQIYYGDEFALDGDAAQHPNVRLDFKGGWKGDKENYFDEKSLTGRADSAFKFLKKLLGWRKSSKSISEGRFVHYLPEDNLYVYFRIAANEKVMVLVNGNDKIGSVDLSRFAEISSSDGPARNVLTSEMEKSSGTIRKVDPHGIQILEWKK
jgi:glycosidase